MLPCAQPFPNDLHEFAVAWKELFLLFSVLEFCFVQVCQLLPPGRKHQVGPPRSLRKAVSH